MVRKHRTPLSCRIGLGIVLATAVTGAASAQTRKDREALERTAAAIAAYEKTVDRCHYEPSVGPALNGLARVYSSIYPALWDRVSREAPLSINGASNLATLLQGGTKQSDECQTLGFMVGTGLVAAAMLSTFDPVLMKEAERLTTGLGRAKAIPGSMPSTQIPSGTPQAPSQAGSFPLSDKGFGATIIEFKGADGTSAYAAGTVKRGDAAEYCERDPGGETINSGGKLSVEQCIEKTLQEQKGKYYQAQANCKTGTLNTFNGSTFSLIKIEDGFGEWRNDKGEVLDGSSASGAPTVDAQFRLLCPSRYSKIQ
jgi:hypothetical protein